MGFFDNIGSKLTADNLTSKAAALGNQATGKAKDQFEQLKLTGEINSYKSQIQQHYQTIGEWYYDEKRDLPVEADYESELAAIDHLNRLIEERQGRKEEIRAQISCPFCGKSIVSDSLFCLHCGSPIPHMTAQPVDQSAPAAVPENKEEETSGEVQPVALPVEEEAAPEAVEDVQPSVVEEIAEPAAEDISGPVDAVSEAEETDTDTSKENRTETTDEVPESESVPAAEVVEETALAVEEGFSTVDSVEEVVSPEEDKDTPQAKAQEVSSTVAIEESAPEVDTAETTTPSDESVGTLATKMCPKCGAVMESDAVFCAECGTKIGSVPSVTVPEQKICPQCGAVVEDDAMFCYECGRKLR